LLILPFVQLLDSLAGKPPTHVMMSVFRTDCRTRIAHIPSRRQLTHSYTDLEEETIVLGGTVAAAETSNGTNRLVRRAFTMPQYKYM
jgi:hypothetical protein